LIELLAVQQQEAPVGPVRHREERDRAGLAHLRDAGALSCATLGNFVERGPGADPLRRVENQRVHDL